MKNVLIAVVLFFSLNAVAQENSLKWYTDLREAVDISMKENKPMFLLFTGSDWCGWCKRLQREVFVQPQFESWAKKNVILVELDFPRWKQQTPEIRQQNMKVAQLFGIRGYPTVWFVTPSVENSTINFNKLGSTGYVAGGPKPWLEVANKILHSQN